jgi:hypothetical protein
LKNGEHSRHIFGRPTSGFTACRESSQPSGSQTVAAEVFDLTLVEPEKEKNEALVVWKKLELKLRIKSEKK